MGCDIMIVCNRNCIKCKHLNTNTDNKGYPYGYECLKYKNSVFKEKFTSSKEFSNCANDMN